MDPRIVTNLLDNPEIAELGGERREMTVMFIDLKGFTSISEALAPDDLVKMINRFFGHMTDAISDNNGVVDKFMGDAVMAYWGPPFTEVDEHAGMACRAALQALEHLELFRSDVKQELGDKAEGLDIDLRIGISTGEMIVGTVGSRVSMSFTIMGDPVNLGARLEGANKAYGTRAMISERTRELAGNDIAVRELDLIRVKGKSEPTRVYELLSVRDEQLALPAPACEFFPAGLKAYRRQAWDHSSAAFKACLESNPYDSAAAVYLERITQLRAKPPRSNWDGVWEFETK
jgi:adenylate cyclase